MKTPHTPENDAPLLNETAHVAGHAPVEPRDGYPTTCACGSSTTMTFAEHVEYQIRQDQIRRTGIDVCAGCGDVVVNDGNGWSHYRGPGSRIVRCQHTVPYGYDATPAHDGRYFPVGLRTPPEQTSVIPPGQDAS